MSPTSRWLYAVCFVLAAAGFLLAFWPLSALAVLVCALSGRIVFALLIGLLIDLALGAPTGTAQYLYFPFVALALFGFCVRYWGGRYLRNRSTQDTV